MVPTAYLSPANVCQSEASSMVWRDSQFPSCLNSTEFSDVCSSIIMSGINIIIIIMCVVYRIRY